MRAEKEIRERREIERILEEAEVGRLGMCIDGRPYVVPVNFAYHEGKIFLHSAKGGRKLEALARNPRVCFEVDEGEVVPKEKPCDYTVRYRSVIASGEAEIRSEPKKMLEALRLIVEKYAPKERGTQLTEETVSGYKNLVVVEIRIEEMTGKRSPV